MYEENFRGSLAEILEHFKAKTIKGEIVIVVGGNTE
jgi:16S rRNA (cytidine1402-2'-O)-methyltransferase